MEVNQTEAEVLDLLTQIKEVNQMIDLHKAKANDEFMVMQYAKKKIEFLNQLNLVLANYDIELSSTLESKIA